MKPKYSSDSLTCDCVNWCDTNLSIRVLTGHHENCLMRGDITAAWKQLVRELVKGMQDWAADEDGIHPDAWYAYKKGKALLGEYNCKGGQYAG